MDFYLSPHAEQELVRRDIPRDYLARVLQNPQQVVDERDGRRAYQSQLEFANGKIYLVRAIVDGDTEPTVMVTVYRTSRISKYWRAEP
ncbi:DUF4258 domain-containing protein [Nodosilinea sp. LEGE 07088]|uniref:DUF4258 domain-containing protein n=1 Tax=Nodosilinea sp. LEGE 07088 TaxID=2777968 RepID=UPI00187FE466|nr:DUF4258 domain-containing protein [Nodosilinea sp. LEGE 07088]MBE9139126.1 DUF4258 domain-containing protein [Nodosilinea sp. LEGE 07088]